MLRSNFVFSLIAGCLAAAAPLGAVHAEVKIGVVNFEVLLQQSPQLKAIGQSLQSEFGERDRVLQQQQKDFKAKLEKFQRDQAVMGEAEKSKLERELRDGQRDLERRGNELKDDANLRQNEEIGKLQRALIAEVETFSKNGGYDLVIGKNVVLYGKETFDITNQVLAILQQKAAKSAGPPAAAPAATKPAAPPAKP